MEAREKIRRALEEDTFYPDTARLLRDRICRIEKLNNAFVQEAAKRLSKSYTEGYENSTPGWNRYLADMRLVADAYIAMREELYRD